ncbi:MAG: TlpA disulfide reductase family protein, partial [Candidatus Omnitrophota bacterium]
FSSTRGKVVILDFWATWCPPCTAEIPHFVELYKEYRERGLEIVGVALDRGGASTVKPFAERNGMNYTVVIGDQRITADYGGIRGIPTTFVVDRQGRIAQKFVGYREKEVFEEAIKSLL